MTSAFIMRLVNGQVDPWGEHQPRFIDRLTYAAAPSRWRLPAKLFHGSTTREVVLLRHRWARSHRRRRVRQDRRRIGAPGWDGTLPVRSKTRHRYDAWGGN